VVGRVLEEIAANRACEEEEEDETKRRLRATGYIQ